MKGNAAPFWPFVNQNFTIEPTQHEYGNNLLILGLSFTAVASNIGSFKKINLNHYEFV